MIGGIAVGLTNQMDYSRFASRPGDQVAGQWISIIGFGAIMPVFGCLASSATQKIYGEAIWYVNSFRREMTEANDQQESTESGTAVRVLRAACHAM